MSKYQSFQSKLLHFINNSNLPISLSENEIHLSSFYKYNNLDHPRKVEFEKKLGICPIKFSLLGIDQVQMRETPVQNQNLISKLSFMRQF